MGRGGGGQVVSVLAFYSDNPSSNLAEAYSFFLQILCLKIPKINKKTPGLGYFYFCLRPPDVTIDGKA